MPVEPAAQQHQPVTPSPQLPSLHRPPHLLRRLLLRPDAELELARPARPVRQQQPLRRGAHVATPLQERRQATRMLSSSPQAGTSFYKSEHRARATDRTV